MVNFGLLAAEILSLVWGTRANFNGFRVLAALLHGILVVGVSQTAALNSERHLYSAGRPSRWALAHIVVLVSVATGAQLGTVISLPLSAVLCHYIGWQVVFYAVGNYTAYYLLFR